MIVRFLDRILIGAGPVVAPLSAAITLLLIFAACGTLTIQITRWSPRPSLWSVPIFAVTLVGGVVGGITAAVIVETRLEHRIKNLYADIDQMEEIL